MKPQHHFFIGVLYTAFLFILFEEIGFFAATIIWLSSWLFIDLDHAIRYTILTKDMHPLRFLRWSEEQTKRWMSLSASEKKHYKLPVFAFHGIEMMTILLIASIVSPLFLYMFLGFIFHHMCDYIDIYYKKENFGMKLSLIYVLLYNRNRKQFH